MSREFSATTIATPGFSGAAQPSWTVIGGGKPREEDAGLDALQRIGNTSRFKKNATIFSEGEPSQLVYKVVSGAVRTCRLLVDGRRQIADFHQSGDFFGLGWQDAHRFTAEALADTVVIGYPRKQLDALGEATPAIQRLLMAMLCKGLAATQDHVVMLGRQTAYERLAWFLLRVMERTGRGNETVSRGISEFKRRRYISATGVHRMRVIEFGIMQALARGGAAA
jgi:CRP/FNR family nitrogen fixation transcriptional regulator